ncbi:AMP-binding protein [Mycobacterium sp. 1245852.3]|uniref:AMP-binding protein n=1 Tax=Mycobacterium sp. 1245852.3 TaxID=1856860 RepID=UPI0007FD855C|nr:AMP-binding protein [Mycobacterium sp. 1245852.3]OBJ83309.1 acyl-CoA synthetase [Mycobacterium sp. 1245852.3]
MIYTPEVTEIDVPLMNLADFILAQAGDARSGNLAVVDAVSGEELTYGDLDDLSARAAAGLSAAGVRPGDVVALIAHNQPLFVVAVYAILRVGAVVSPMNPVLTDEEIRKQLRTAQAKVVIHGLDSTRLPRLTVNTSVEVAFSLGHTQTDAAFRTLFAHDRLTAYQPRSPREIAALPFSSGTTGAGKGVMLSHGNLIANLVQLHNVWPLTDGDVVCAVLPLFHIYGFSVIMNLALRAGATMITMPRFDLDSYLRVIQDKGVTFGHLAPPIVLALANSPAVDQYDLSSMKRAISAAAPLDESLANRVQERTGVVIRQAYGMTEASPGTHSVAFRDYDATPPGAVGRLLPATEARIIDPRTGADAAPGEPGELWVRGPQVMLGYLDLLEATSATLVDGWLRSGDILQCREGNFYVVDRLKELIKYKGYQVAPAELEAVVLCHPAVIDAAVIGIPDPEAGELPVAYVVADVNAGPRPDAASVMAFVAERVAPYKKLRDVVFVDQIPKSASGKILRRFLKDEAIKVHSSTAAH